MNIFTINIKTPSMIEESSLLWKTIDPNKKDAKWCNLCVELIRRNWVQLKDSITMKENKEIIFSMQSMEKVKKMFKDKEFLKNTDIEPLGVWNKIVNIIVEEITKNPPRVELKANDATALSDKEEDIRRLRMKAPHEKIVNAITSRIGEPPTIVNTDSFKTNIDEFYRMGLDPSDPEDIDFYAQNDFPRLKYEIAGQKIINIIMKLNRFDKELVRDGVLDILAGLCFCIQTYVDAVTGEIKYDRIYPEEAYGVWGDKRDGSDDVGKGWVKNLTVREWLGRVGNDFSFSKDWMQLLWAINYTNKTKFTGFIRYGNRYDCWENENLMTAGTYNGAAESNLMDYSLAYTYEVYSGYTEWDSPEATGTYLARYDTGELIPTQIPFDTFLEQKGEIKEYYKESFYGWQMYKSYFLPTSSTTQWIYGFGKLYYQQLEGAYDEYCKGTLMYYRLEGKSAAEISKPYIEFANLCYYRMKWVVYHSKPQKEQYIIEELIKVAKATQRMFPQTTQSAVPTVDTILTQLINWKRENFIDLRSYPEIDGKTIGQLPPQEGAKNGIDQLAIGLQAVEQWLEMQIAEKVGLNDMRLAQIQNAREGFKKGQQETEASLNSTSYVYRIIQLVKEHTALCTLNYSQDIVRFKDTIPYKWLLKQIGKDEFENSAILKDFSSHRFGLTVEEYQSQMQRQKLMQAADMALDKKDGNGGITIMEWGILNKTNDYDDGLRKLSLFKYKAEKRLRKQKLEELKIQHDNIMEEKKADAQSAKDNNDAKQLQTETLVKGQMYVADKNAAAKIEVKEMSNEHEPIKQDLRTQSQKTIIDAKKNAEEQEAAI